MFSSQLSSLLREPGESSRDAVQGWITAALAYSSALRQHHGSLYPKSPERQASAERLHQEWRAWVEDAKVVLEVSNSALAADRDLSGVAALRDEIARAETLLALPPSLIARRREQVDRGEVYPLDEVRRELRAGNRG